MRSNVYHAVAIGAIAATSVGSLPCYDERTGDPSQSIVDGSIHARLDVALRDLREWHILRAWCKNCSHHVDVKSEALIKRYGKDALFSTIELLCFAGTATVAGRSGWNSQFAKS